MTQLSFSGTFRLEQLHDEVVASDPAALRGDESAWTVSAGEHDAEQGTLAGSDPDDDGCYPAVTFTLDESLDAAKAKGALGKIVAAHVPATAAAVAVEAARGNAQQRVLTILAATDKWAARAYEDGVPMSDARKAYRQALRATYEQIATSDDPESVTLPEPPAAE